MIEVKLLGPKDSQYALLSDGGKWLATCWAEHAEAVKAAIEAANANGNDPTTTNKEM